MKRWEIFCGIPEGRDVGDADPILRDLARVTGGYTVYPVTGGWIGGDGKLVKDTTIVVVTWGVNIERAIETACERLRSVFLQDSVVAVATEVTTIMDVFPGKRRDLND